MINKCSQCGLCCRLFLINLSEEEYRFGKYKTQLEKFGMIQDFKKATSCGANILKQNEDGSCIYLKGNMCSIHKKRPQACRHFFCTSKSKKFKNMIETIENEQKKQKIEK
jgi:Fe-S-cluster containining protein